MTDKNRQKGNESVGEKSDGLARDMDGLEALRKGADESREVFDGWYHAQIRNGMSPQDIAFNIHCANASNVRELAAYRYAALARPAPEALGAAKGVTPTGAGLHAMELLGGSFVKSLAASYYAADVENKRKLIDAFAEYFDRYEAIAKQKGIEA